MITPHEVCLHLIPGIGPITARILLQHFSTAENIFKQTKQSLTHIDGIGEATAQLLLKHQFYLKEADDLIRLTQKQNTQMLFLGHDNYPSRLKQIPDAPLILFRKGVDCLDLPRMISVVGTRKATDYGKRITSQLIQDLQPWNPVIVSGLAYGIDIHAHRAALQYGLSTVGVLAHGLDRLYPPTHYETAQKMIQDGALLTEYGWGKGPEPTWFASRNRIIAGLCDATIVVEAAEKGGALITASLANSYDREVMAFPGRTDDAYSAGCHRLIQSHQAHLITSAQDIVELLCWDEENKKPIVRVIPKGLSDEQIRILQLLIQNDDPHIDELCMSSGFTPQYLSLLLLELEMQGLIQGLPGKKYRCLI